MNKTSAIAAFVFVLVIASAGVYLRFAEGPVAKPLPECSPQSVNGVPCIVCRTPYATAIDCDWKAGK